MSFHKGSGVVGEFVLNQVNEKTVLKARVFEYDTTSEKVIDQNRTFSGVAQLWNEQERSSRSLWWALGQQMADPEDNRLRPTLTAYQAFQSVQNALSAIGADYNPVALPAPVAPAQLPDVSVQATLTGGSTPSFTLVLESVDYAHAVQVFAQAPLYGTQDVDKNGPWKLLTTVSNMVSSGTSIGPDFKAVFGMPALSDKIAVRLVPISAQGFRGTPLKTWGIVSPPAQEATGTDDGEHEEGRKAA